MAQSSCIILNWSEQACLFYCRYEDNPEKDTKEGAKTEVESSEDVNGEAKKSQ